MTALDEFRAEVRAWCAANVPADWRQTQAATTEDEFVAFQQDWFAKLHAVGYAVPHWPAEWGGGMSVAEQVVLYQELAARDAPRLVLAFVGIHHAASTLLVAGTEEQRQRHLAGHFGRRDLGAGFLRTGSRLGPGVVADHRPPRR